jgi:hypothetical protein
MSEIETQPEGTNGASTAQSAPTGETPIDPALIEKLAALRSIVKINNILSSCIVQGSMASDILIGQEFLKNLHAPILKEAETHPDYKRATDPQGYAAEKKAAAQAEELKIRAEEKRDRKAEKKSLIGRLRGRAN